MQKVLGQCGITWPCLCRPSPSIVSYQGLETDHWGGRVFGMEVAAGLVEVWVCVRAGHVLFNVCLVHRREW